MFFVDRMKNDLIEILNEAVDQYNRKSFIENDPISIPHRFEKKEDIEIAAFLTAIISWGNRTSILKSADRMMQRMGHSPHEFVMEAKQKDAITLGQTIHRTFNAEDFWFFILSLRHIYSNEFGLEGLFTSGFNMGGSYEALVFFRSKFMNGISNRSSKHVADVERNSSAKRLNMFLRWMVRSDDRGVDFGLWKDISPSKLSIPLDVHSGNTARKLGLLNRRQNDWRAVAELDCSLRQIDVLDPVKYDFALFSLGESGIWKQK
jgi:uncharacterized protein (TIGR02757 family)